MVIKSLSYSQVPFLCVNLDHLRVFRDGYFGWLFICGIAVVEVYEIALLHAVRVDSL